MHCDTGALPKLGGYVIVMVLGITCVSVAVHPRAPGLKISGYIHQLFTVGGPNL